MWVAVHNHVAQATFPICEPWRIQNIRGEFASKDAFRRWCADAETTHCFFSPVEATNPGMRVYADNAPFRLHGFVVDYDADVNLDELQASAMSQLDLESRPRAIGATFSGGARAVWEFEEPLWVDQGEMAEAIMKKLAQEFKVRRLAPGYDPASEQLSQFWELGTDWREIPGSMRVPSHITTAIQFAASLAAKRVRNSVEIPLDIVREEIERQYPGRLTGRFELGARIPLFWVNDGRSDLAAIVAEWGCYSFSTRSNKGSMAWGELLGNGFVQQFQQRRIEEAIQNMYFDGKYYISKTGKNWVFDSKDDTIENLKVRGYSHRLGADATATECNQILYYIRTEKRVDFAAPVPHSQDELVYWGGDRILNTLNRRAMSPAEYSDTSQFPWLTKFFDNFFDQHPLDLVHPKYYFLAELQRAYQSVMLGEPRLGHVLILAGPTGRGKSLLTTVIMKMIFGSAGDAGEFLLGSSHFNKELAESYVWYVDDNRSAANLTEHQRFSEYLKKHAATPVVNHHGKFRDQRAMPWFGRVVLTCNEDPESVSIIPNLDINIMDKLSLFLVSKWKAEFMDSQSMMDMLRKELPFFLKWLLEDYDPQAHGVGVSGPRYGVQEYHHAGLVDMATEGSMELKSTEILDLWLRQFSNPNHYSVSSKKYYWAGTSTELLSLMMDQERLYKVLRNHNVNNFGKFMAKLYKSRVWPHLMGRTTSRGNSAIWWIELPANRASGVSSRDLTVIE